jgi:hypothetical protein
MLALLACGPSKSKGSSTTIDGPAAFSRGRWCELQFDSAATYYVELPTSARWDKMCGDSKHRYTHAEFQAIPGLRRQCVFDSSKEIATNDGVVGIYSDNTQASIDAARMICTDAGH